MQKLSRRKIAEYVADQSKGGKIPSGVIAEVAAYLSESHRIREIPLVVRTIEDVLAERGQVVARIASAYPLSDELRNRLEAELGKSVYMQETVDADLLGGIKIDTPGKSLDATLIRKVNNIRKLKQA